MWHSVIFSSTTRDIRGVVAPIGIIIQLSIPTVSDIDKTITAGDIELSYDDSGKFDLDISITVAQIQLGYTVT